MVLGWLGPAGTGWGGWAWPWDTLGESERADTGREGEKTKEQRGMWWMDEPERTLSRDGIGAMVLFEH